MSNQDWAAHIKKLREYRKLAYNTGFLHLADWMEEMADALASAPGEPDLSAMRVIDPDQWEPCSPEYLKAGGDCAHAPRVWNATDKNHWHPKLIRCEAVENYREPGEFGEGATVRRAELPSQHFLDLLDQYWKAAYQQGQEGRNHDDKEGSAQIAESALCAYVEGLRAQLIRMVEIAERRLIDLSAARASLYKIAAYDDAAANAYLRATGSYRCFDEPGAVEMARDVLEGGAK